MGTQRTSGLTIHDPDDFRRQRGTMATGAMLVGIVAGCCWPYSLFALLLGFKKPNPNVPQATVAGIILGVFLSIPAAGGIAALALPHFFSIREVYRRNACQANQLKIDAAVQQYIFDYNFKGQRQAVQWLESHGDISDLVGRNNLLTTNPQCPSGGVYMLNSIEGQPGVYCTYAGHDFPGADDEAMREYQAELDRILQSS